MTAGGLICVSGILRLIEYFIAQGQAVGYPQQLEHQMLSADPNNIGTIGSAYQNVFLPLPPQTALPQNIVCFRQSCVTPRGRHC
jgi:hypothetical protein